MSPTVFGYLVVGAALILMFGSITSMLSLVLIASLFGAASAVDLPGLGGASVTPASVAILFLALRVSLSSAGRFPVIAKAIQQNPYLAFFCIYSAATAFLLPELFSHTINVPPLRDVGNAVGNLFATSPVQFSSQNITTAVYLLSTLLVSLSAYIACAYERHMDKLLITIFAVSWCHIGFGILDIVLSNFGVRSWLDVFRTANYFQLNQDIGGVQRVAGIFPESSAYATYGFTFFVLSVELWMRNQKKVLSGITAIGMLAILLLTTSSTAYVSIAAYAIVLPLRMIFTRTRLAFAKAVILIAIGGICVTALLSIEVFLPAMGALMFDILQQMTFQKLNTASGLQRSFWAQKGWEAFWSTDWIGIGAGSFRSSGLISSVAGSCGILGLLALFGSVWRVLNPLQDQTHNVLTPDKADRISAAFGWAAVVGLIPQMLGAPTPDPGIMFGIFSGVAVSRLIVQTNLQRAAVQRGIRTY
jgi:hypothetical protein